MSDVYEWGVRYETPEGPYQKAEAGWCQSWGPHSPVFLMTELEARQRAERLQGSTATKSRYWAERYIGPIHSYVGLAFRHLAWAITQVHVYGRDPKAWTHLWGAS